MGTPLPRGGSMKSRNWRELIVVDLIGELDVALSARLNDQLSALASSVSATIVVRLERIDSVHHAGLSQLANVIVKHRRIGIDVRAQSRLRRICAVLEEFAIPGDMPSPDEFHARRRLIIARTPRPINA